MRLTQWTVTFLVLLAIHLTASPGLGWRQDEKPETNFYLTASAKFNDGTPTKLHLRGLSNLPFGAMLTVNVYDFTGPGHKILNTDASAQVGSDGLFDVTLLAVPGSEFRHNVACEVVFSPTFPTQPRSVLAAVGNSGEKLGFPKNPEAELVSGGQMLSLLIHVP